MGRLSAMRQVLQTVINAMSKDDQKKNLLEWVATQTANSRQAQRNNTSEWLAGMVEEFERIEFLIREQLHLPQGDEAVPQQPYFVCIQCNGSIHVLPSDGLCPYCGSAKLEITHRPI